MRKALAALGVVAVVAAGIAWLSGVFAPQSLPPGFLPTLSAELRAEDDSLGFSALYDPDSGQLSVTRTVGPAAAEGQAYLLWTVGEDGSPTALGPLTTEVTDFLAEGLSSGTVLEVTAEALPVAPDGRRGGPVLMRGTLGEL